MAAAAAGVVLATALFEVNNSFLITDFSTRGKIKIGPHCVFDKK